MSPAPRSALALLATPAPMAARARAYGAARTSYEMAIACGVSPPRARMLATNAATRALRVLAGVADLVALAIASATPPAPPAESIALAIPDVSPAAPCEAPVVLAPVCEAPVACEPPPAPCAAPVVLAPPPPPRRRAARLPARAYREAAAARQVVDGDMVCVFDAVWRGCYVSKGPRATLLESFAEFVEAHEHDVLDLQCEAAAKGERALIREMDREYARAHRARVEAELAAVPF